MNTNEEDDRLQSSSGAALATLKKTQSLLVCTLIIAELVLSTSGMIILIAVIGLVLLAATRLYWRRALKCEVERTIRLTIDAFRERCERIKAEAEK